MTLSNLKRLAESTKTILKGHNALENVGKAANKKGVRKRSIKPIVKSESDKEKLLREFLNKIPPISYSASAELGVVTPKYVQIKSDRCCSDCNRSLSKGDILLTALKIREELAIVNYITSDEIEEIKRKIIDLGIHALKRVWYCDKCVERLILYSYEYYEAEEDAQIDALMPDEF